MITSILEDIRNTGKGIVAVFDAIYAKTSAIEHELKQPHSTNNEVKIDEFVGILSKRGWMGVPLVVGSGGNLLSGTHRFLALKRMGYADKDVPTISIKELCRMYNIDIGKIQNWGPIKRGSRSFDEIRRLLPEKVIRKYGLK